MQEPKIGSKTHEVPLIWTSKGNLPLESLKYATRWERGEDYVKFIEIHTLNGEVVREAAHVLALKPTSLDAEAGSIN